MKTFTVDVQKIITHCSTIEVVASNGVAALEAARRRLSTNDPPVQWTDSVSISHKVTSVKESG